MSRERVYRPVDQWEEVAHGMWSDVREPGALLRAAIEFTADHCRYGQYMLRVVREWPISCENALTDPHLSKLAWIGHAACALAIGCPEDITRKAWGHLSDEQRLLANKAASRALREWEHAYAARRGLRESVGSALLFDGDPG